MTKRESKKTFVPVKERLDEKLQSSDNIAIKAAILDWCTEKEIDIYKVKPDSQTAKTLLTYVQNLNSDWNTLDPADISTVHLAIKKYVDIIRW